MAKLSMIEAAMVAKVEPADIEFLVREVAKLHDEVEYTGFEAHCAILFEYFKEAPRVETMFAIVERMRCLAKLTEDERMRGWTMESVDPDCTLTHGTVIAATALCPLHSDDEKFWFDPDEFFDLALRKAEPENHA